MIPVRSANMLSANLCHDQQACLSSSESCYPGLTGV
nr:MAG TPA: hypothetical protein [Caudoviricetes sp.]